MGAAAVSIWIFEFLCNLLKPVDNEKQLPLKICAYKQVPASPHPDYEGGMLRAPYS